MSRFQCLLIVSVAFIIGCSSSPDPELLVVPDKEYRELDEIMALPGYSQWDLIQTPSIQGPFRILGKETTRSASRPVGEFTGIIQAEGHNAQFAYNQSGKYHFVAAILLENQEKELGVIMLGGN